MMSTNCQSVLAKNITLAGIKSLTVNDHEKATWLDLSTNFYLKSEHVKNGSNRAEACAPRLGELNPYARHAILAFQVMMVLTVIVE